MLGLFSAKLFRNREMTIGSEGKG